MKSAARLLLAAALGAALAGCFKSVGAPDLSDPAVLANIESQLKAEKSLDLSYVTLDVHSGVVTVSGLINSWQEKRLIEKIVRHAPGVQEAVINLAVQE